MPIYSYRCENCGVQFDRYQKFSEKQLTKCPECGEKALRKLFQPVGIVFKGSGFYVTDNRSSNNHNTMRSSSSGTKGEESSKPSTDKAPASTSDD
jgi:putative FmdB family regulatory protein